jgi:hypothetical protein
MRGEVALVREQGQEFAVLAVRDSVINDPSRREEMMQFGEAQFGIRTALIGAKRGRTWGPADIVRWLSNVHPAQLPWREFTLN